MRIATAQRLAKRRCIQVCHLRSGYQGGKAEHEHSLAASSWLLICGCSFLSQSSLQICRQQPMEQMFTCLTPH